MRKLPYLAVVLMLAGLLPFILCTCGIVFYDSTVPVPRLLMGLVLYGALSLSFLGAVHWGWALESERVILTVDAGRVDTLRLLLGVLPLLAGWVAAFAAVVSSPLTGVALLAMAFAGVILCERAAWRRGWLPQGYMGVRWIVTAVTECCLLTVLLMRGL
jgi:hypothetical protein